MAAFGHSGSHAPQLMHSSVILRAISYPFLRSWSREGPRLARLMPRRVRSSQARPGKKLVVLRTLPIDFSLSGEMAPILGHLVGHSGQRPQAKPRQDGADEEDHPQKAVPPGRRELAREGSPRRQRLELPLGVGAAKGLGEGAP